MIDAKAKEWFIELANIDIVAGGFPAELKYRTLKDKINGLREFKESMLKILEYLEIKEPEEELADQL
jgi:hypothetical protein